MPVSRNTRSSTRGSPSGFSKSPTGFGTRVGDSRRPSTKSLKRRSESHESQEPPEISPSPHQSSRGSTSIGGERSRLGGRKTDGRTKKPNVFPDIARYPQSPHPQEATAMPSDSHSSSRKSSIYAPRTGSEDHTGPDGGRMAAVSQRFSHEDAHERQINLPQGSRGTQDGEEDHSLHDFDDDEWITLRKIGSGIDDSSGDQDSVSDLEQYREVRRVVVERGPEESNYDAEVDDQDEDDSEHPDTRAAAGNKGKGRRRPPGIRFLVPDPEDLSRGESDVEQDQDLEGQDENPGEPLITRAELVDYLDRRDRAVARVLERIEGRLGYMEEHLQAARPRTPQAPPAREQRRGSGRSNRSDPSLRRYIRSHTTTMLGIKNLRDDDIPENPDEDEIANFNETGKHGPSKEPKKWRPDLLGPKQSPWNKAAARRFRRHFLKCAEYGDWPAEQVEKALFVHMDTLRARYKTQNGQRSLDERLQMAIKASRASRLKTLARQRKIACEWEDDLSKFAPYVQKLCDEGGVSGDESDNNHRPGRYQGQVNYFRVRPIWRARHVSSWLDIIDKVYVAFRFQENNRATPGNWIRKRHPTNRVDEKANAISGLPENFYDRDWLKTLTQKKRRKLRMEPPLDLKHTPSVMRIAARYSGVKRRADIPLEVDTEDDGLSQSPSV